MFGGSRRHRAPNPPLTASTANPNAATAAASAFARREPSTTSLSAAAAAAALRARPTTPINVADVQTKRTRRRSASVSSHGSHDARRPGLQRSPSTGSMTDRSFRSPSPHRGAPATTGDVPPVPSIPGNVQTNQTTNGTAHRRATSLQTQPFRVASQKKKDGTGSWFGSAKEGNPANVRTSDAVLQSKSPEPRPGSVSPSINFSYPRALNSGSPSTSPTAEVESPARSQRLVSPRSPNSRPSSIVSTDQSLVYDPNSRRMVPRSDLLLREQAVRDASEKPPKKKKSQGLGRSGSHLSKGTMGRTQGIAVAAEGVRQPRSPPPPAYASTEEPAQTSHRSDVENGERTRTTISPTQSRQLSSPELVTESRQPITQDLRATDGATILPRSDIEQKAPVLGRKPSMVREEPEDEDLESDEKEIVPRNFTEVLDAAPVKYTAVPRPQITNANNAQAPIELPAETPLQPLPTTQNEATAPELKQYGSIRSVRGHSNSPVRSAHFGTATDQLAVRHEPPARSVSPRKSALKHSSSPSRGASPSDDSSEASGMGRLTVDTTAIPREDPGVPKKKSVRVSFDDQNTVVVGQAAPPQDSESPIVASPQARRPWYSNIGRSKKKDLVELDDDEVMKPRPALPSFGSVREKKTRDAEERPLVRPVELENSPSIPASPATFPSTPETEDHGDILGQSSDLAIGSLLSQEQTSRNAANISKFREPLPPVVTSLEGSGYYSASTTSSEDEEEPEIVTEPEPTLPPEQVKEEILATDPDMPLNGSTKMLTGPVFGNGVAPTKANEDIPSISIVQPSPLPIEKSDEAGPSYFAIPGGFPEDESDASFPPEEAASQESRDKVVPIGGTLRDEPVASIAEPRTPEPHTNQSKAISYAAIAEEQETDDSGIYSDAYEDLSDVDGDGFMSLDAVLTTPVSEKVSQKLFEKAMARSSKEPTMDSQPRSTEPDELMVNLSLPSQQNIPEDDWEKAKAYWRGLTNEKRRQLEKEAVEEVAVDADVEESTPARRRSRKKKKTAKEEQPVNPERTYQIKPGTKMLLDEREAPASSMRKTLRGQQASSNDTGTTRLKKSMRGEQPIPAAASEVGMRKTMRGAPPAPAPAPVNKGESYKPGRQELDDHAIVTGGMRKSMRQNGTNLSGDTLHGSSVAPRGGRPLSLQQAPSDRAVLTKHSRNLSHDVPLPNSAAAQVAKPTIRRRGSDSSESSFKRARAPQEGFAFRRTMRASGPPEPLANTSKGSGRFSLRSLSPPSSPFRRGSGVVSPPPVSMRGSLRPTLRNDSSDGSTHRMRIPSFGRSSGKKAASKSSKISSRFGDSSDEDAAGPSAFRSRFAESSDEDEVPSQISTRPKSSASAVSGRAAAAALHVAPSHAFDEKEEDSPDLPDSSDEDIQQPPPKRTSSGRMARSQSDNIQGLQRKRSGRGGIIDSATSPALGTQAMSDRPGRGRRSSLMSVLRRKKDHGSGKISRPQFSESGARVDTKLERSADELAAIRVNSTSPRLQKRIASWPLAEATDEEKRPATAGNDTPADESARPGFMKRRSTSQGLLGFGHQKNAVDVPVAESEAGGKKKKKFGTLRRMFGLDE